MFRTSRDWMVGSMADGNHGFRMGDGLRWRPDAFDRPSLLPCLPSAMLPTIQSRLVLNIDDLQH